jgi:hypothetical protein
MGNNRLKGSALPEPQRQLTVSGKLSVFNRKGFDNPREQDLAQPQGATTERRQILRAFDHQAVLVSCPAPQPRVSANSGRGVPTIGAARSRLRVRNGPGHSDPVGLMRAFEHQAVLSVVPHTSDQFGTPEREMAAGLE